jgi:hypothetical protein
MGFFDAIKRTTWAEVKVTIVWLLLNVFAGILPIGGSYLMIRGFGQTPAFRDPLRHGELALLSISLLASAIYVISRGFKLSGLPSRNDNKESRGLGQILNYLRNISFPGSLGFISVIFVLAIFGTLLFALAISADFMDIQDNAVIDNRIVWTEVLLVATLITTFLVTLIENTMSSSAPDARELMGDDYKKWERKMNKELEEKLK